MERKSTIEEAKRLFNNNFIGIRELSPLFKTLGFSNDLIEEIVVPDLQYSFQKLKSYAKDYILILGIGRIDNNDLSIRFFRDKIGFGHNVSEPRFYNQDWYLRESFIDRILEKRWYLIRKNVFEEFRSISPEIIMRKPIEFPSAILCAYTFFSYYYYNKKILWEHDYIWCQDTDYNFDQIYVGRYSDRSGLSKSGFSIHRHLKLRDCYSAISVEY